MSIALFAATGVAPVVLLVGLRYIAFRKRMDAHARRSYRHSAVLFLVPITAASAVLFAHRGALSLPAAWALALSAVTTSLLAGVIKRDPGFRSDPTRQNPS
jgi:cytochrome bd-type quinol oxidase subunit 2